MLYLVCGLPGTGKSTVARELERLTGGVVLRTDEIRKRILSDPKYTPEEKQKVYDALFRTAESLLRMGKDVILDATFYKRGNREDAKKLAENAGEEVLIIEVTCDEKYVFSRLKNRKGGLSDADYGVYKKIRSEWEPIREEHVVLDMGRKDWKRGLKRALGDR